MNRCAAVCCPGKARLSEADRKSRNKLSERRIAVQTFTTGGADLLLATDAGSEGVNLQSNCRLVINLELPWNPVRLEQRIGRVDRIGQRRTVHAIHLFGARTAESRVLAGLVRRIDRIRTEADIALETQGR